MLQRRTDCAVQKANPDKIQAKGYFGCTLHELCSQDKQKVAKLLRQVSKMHAFFNLPDLTTGCTLNL